MKIFSGEYGAIKCLNSLRALTRYLDSLIRQIPWKSYVFFLCHFVLIFYLSMSFCKAEKQFACCSCNEWQSDYDTPSEISHYYSIVKRELYRGKYLNPLKSFMSSVSRHTFSKLFNFAQAMAFWESLSGLEA